MNSQAQTDPQYTDDNTDASDTADEYSEYSEEQPEDKSLVDDLGVTGTSELLFGKDGRIFSAAGRQSPIAEFAEGLVILHPPQKPLDENAPSEDIFIRADERGILLNELGQRRNIPGAKLNGCPIFWLFDANPGTTKHHTACLDGDILYPLYYESEPATTDIIFKLRNKTHDGELNIFSDLTTDPP